MLKIKCLIILLLFCYKAYTQNNDSINIHNIFLNDLYAGMFATQLDKISKQYKVRFNYNKAKIAEKEFFARPMNESLYSVLTEVCRISGLRFFLDINGDIQIVGRNEKVDIARIRTPEAIKVYIGPPKTFNITINGIVKSASTGESLPNATISLLNGKKNISISNLDGQFSMLNIPSDTCSIYINYMGYQSRVINLNPEMAKQSITVEMYSIESNTLTEVVVSSSRRETMKINVANPGVLRMSPSTLNKLPNIGERDIMRAFQLMPGVSSANENSSGLYVRGGTPDQNLVLYDGFTVYHVDHLFGFFSAFNTNAIKDVQLFKSAFPAKYGGRLSSAMEMIGKDGNNKKVSFGGDISLLSFNAWLEAPINEKVTTLFAVRRSWKSPLYNSLFSKFSGSNTNASSNTTNSNSPFTQTEQIAKSYFYDLNGKITWKPTNKDVVSLSFYNGTDDMDNSRTINLPSFGGANSTNNLDLGIKDLTIWGNLGTSLKWSRKLNAKLSMNSLLSYSNYYSNRNRTTGGTFKLDNGDERSFRNGTIENNNLKDFSFRSDWTYKLNSLLTLEAGYNATYNSIKYSYSQNDTSTILNRNDDGIVQSLYGQTKVSILNDKVQLSPGLRINQFSSTNKIYIEPRFTGFGKLSDKLSIKAAFGIHHQFANRITREDILQGSRDFWLLSNMQNVPVSKSIHYTVGLSYETEGFLFDIETYHKDLNNITEYSLRFNQSGGPTNTSYEENFFVGKGYSKGIEFLLQKKKGDYTGWISYTLSQTRNKFDVYSNNYYPANQDVTNEFKLIQMYKIGQFNLSASWVFASGRPYTAPEGAYTLTLLDGTVQNYVNVGAKNSKRLPSYHRMDISATYTFLNVDAEESGSIGLSLFNLYNRKNTWYKEFEVVNNSLIGTNIKFLGFTPNLTLSLKF